MFNKDGLITNNPSPHSPLQIISKLITPESTVLDIGCNTGVLGKLVGSKAIFDGIDINQSALKVAQKHYRHVYLSDLSNTNKLPTTHKYDYIIMADILEHLPRPDKLLLLLQKHLKPHGQIIASIPNIGRFEIRLQLLFGNFNYQPAGILNQDHLRFFTQKTGVSLFTNCGYKVDRLIPTGLGHQIRILPRLTAFQFIYLASKK